MKAVIQVPRLSMLQTIQAPLFFGLIAAFVTSIGLIAVSVRADWSERHSGLFALAAGGMLITLSLLHIAPEAFELTSKAPVFLLVGFLGGLLLNFSVRAFFPEAKMGDQVKNRAAAFTPLIAVAIHSFIDGIIYSVTFAASFSSGVFAALSLILHEFPEGVIAYAILRRHGFANRRAFFYAFLAAALTTPLGVIASAPFVYGLGMETTGALFAVSAGLLLYVATGPLMAPIHEETPRRSFVALAVGVCVALMITLIPVHGHSHGLHDGEDHHPVPMEAPQPIEPPPDLTDGTNPL
jgi:ZIP family zinc transporter